MTFCHVGTGNTAPSVSDTALQTFVASTSTVVTNTTSVQGTAPYYGSRVTTFRFGTGVAAGNIAELGICHVGTSSGPLFSRALVLDVGGSPTTITVLSTETLDVTYELRYYPPLTDVVATGVSAFGGTYDITLRAARVTGASSWSAGIGQQAGSGGGLMTLTTGAIGAITSSPAGTTIDSQAWAAAAYSATSHVRDLKGTSGIGKPGVIRSFWFTSSIGEYQLEISPTFNKLATQTLDATCRVAWARKSL